jgi:hypothetical protein
LRSFGLPHVSVEGNIYSQNFNITTRSQKLQVYTAAGHQHCERLVIDSKTKSTTQANPQWTIGLEKDQGIAA